MKNNCLGFLRFYLNYNLILFKTFPNDLVEIVKNGIANWSPSLSFWTIGGKNSTGNKFEFNRSSWEVNPMAQINLPWSFCFVYTDVSFHGLYFKPLQCFPSCPLTHPHRRVQSQTWMTISVIHAFLLLRFLTSSYQRVSLSLLKFRRENRQLQRDCSPLLPVAQILSHRDWHPCSPLQAGEAEVSQGRDVPAATLCARGDFPVEYGRGSLLCSSPWGLRELDTT